MKIIKKDILCATKDIRIIRIEVSAPDIAKKALAGQFVALMVEEKGERIPLTIVDKSSESITLIFQEVGLTTKLLAKLKPGDSLSALVGPLGHATEIKKYGRVVLVAGGVGIAEIYPVARALKGSGNELTIILGARTKAALILEEELKELADDFYLTTDDGSYGRKGFTTGVLSEILSKDKYDLVYAVGPIPMMKKVTEVTAGLKVKTIASLNAIMVDATGMCGCCRVSIAGKTKFSCVDGPEFDAHLVDWEELMKRNQVYLDKERHICNLKDKIE
ncbi:MAG: sulfide/dihydroorotate dehydrogenase-like FAD/NAD-binding protein [Candidatus Omnitrophica bacterium]|nr:sulfide/dihydroorotate dehydrogenase-like FAD/NAD-binding protein [Candidatus Omnitrophota bacterium]